MRQMAPLAPFVRFRRRGAAATPIATCSVDRIDNGMRPSKDTSMKPSMSSLFLPLLLALCLAQGSTANAAPVGSESATSAVREHIQAGDRGGAVTAAERALADGEREFGAD